LDENLKLTISGETVEKVPKQTLRGDAEKNDFTECATINDPTMTKGRETPQNHALTILKGFSTVSEEVLGKGAVNFTCYSSIETCFYDRRFRVEIMHGGSIFENQIETF